MAGARTSHLDADGVVLHAVEELAQGRRAGLRHAADATRRAARRLAGPEDGKVQAMRIVVFPGVLRPPSATAL
jgi:hypothetical protein